jgi:hypothetical protein
VKPDDDQRECEFVDDRRPTGPPRPRLVEDEAVLRDRWNARMVEATAARADYEQRVYQRGPRRWFLPWTWFRRWRETRGTDRGTAG